MAGKMKLITGISVILTIIFIIIYRNNDYDIFLTLSITSGTITYHFIMRLIVGAAISGIMHNRADYRKRWYQLRPFEERLYQKIKVKKWKEKLPTYEPKTFSMQEKSLDEIAQAMCQAEIVHEVIIVFSFLPLLASIKFGAFVVFFITSVLAAGLDLLFVIAQRYNRPRVVKIVEKQTEI